MIKKKKKITFCIGLTHVCVSVCVCIYGSPYLCLYHGWSLCPQHLDRLEDVHYSLIPHPLQNNTESDEDPCPPNARTSKRESERQREMQAD